MLHILEDDIPMLYIAGEGVISEDESLEFEVLSTTLPETDTLIQFTPTETGSNFLAIPSGQPMIEQLNFVDDNEVFVATIAIPIDDDDLYEADGSISLTLNTAEGYIVASAPGNTATITIEDNDTPELSISAGPSVNESSGLATFNVISTKLTSEPLAVDYLVQNVTGDFLSGQISRRAELLFTDVNGTDYQATLEVELENDQIDEVDGSILVTLLDNDPDIPDYSVNANRNTATVSISDDDVPTVSLYSDESVVNEGEVVEYRVAVDSAPTDSLVVIVEFSPASLLDSNSSQHRVFNLSASNMEEVFSIQTIDNDFDDGPQILTATIRPSSDHNLSVLNHTVALNFINNDIPTLSFRGNAIGTEQDYGVNTVVLADFQPAKPIYVYFDADNITGDFLEYDEIIDSKVYFEPSELPNEVSFGILEVPIINDQRHEPTGSIAVTLVADPAEYPTYNVVETEANSATLTVYDDDQPEFEIAASTSAIEGQVTEFTLTWQNNPFEDLSVPIQFEPSELIAGNNVQTVDISTTNLQFKETIQVQLADNASFERNSRVLTGTILGGENYLISPEHAAAQVDVFDEAQPLIAIEAIETAVTEGDLITFRVSADKAPLTDLYTAIEFSPSTMVVGDAIRVEEIALADTDHSIEFQVQVADNNVKTRTQQLTATIRDGDHYAPAASPNNQVTISVRDNDENPIISIAPVTSQLGGIVEGKTAEFEVTTSHRSEEELFFRLELTETGDFLVANQEELYELPPFTQSYTLKVLTDNDGLEEIDGTITATLLSSDGSFIAPYPANEASVNVFDNDSATAPDEGEFLFHPETRLPRLSLAIDTDQHPNGFAANESDFSFRIVADQYLDVAIPVVNLTQEVPSVPSLNLFRVNALVPESEDFTIEFPTDVNSSIITRTSAEDELTLTLQPGEGYIVGTPNTVSLARVGQQAGISIFADTKFVSESEPASFMIALESPVTYPVTAHINLDQGISDFIAGDLERTVTIPANTTTSPLIVELVDDQVDEDGGKITASITEGTSYLISPVYNEAITYVTDNDDPPIVSIRAHETEVEEGDVAVFQLTATGQWEHEFSVPLAITETGNFVDLHSGQVIFAPNKTIGGTSASFSVPTIQDDLLEPDSTLTTTILPNASTHARSYYSILVARPSAEIVVVDNDNPILTISAVNSSVSESERAEFKIESNISPLTDITVNLDLSQTRPIVEGSLANYTSVTLHQGRTAATLSIPLINDSAFNNNAYIRVSLADGLSYRLEGSAIEAEIYVEDDDLLNELTIQRVTNVIEEGDPAKFLIATQPVNFDRVLDYSVTKVGDFFTESELSFVILPTNEANFVLEIPTIDDEFDEEDGSVEIVLNDGDSYTVAPTHARAIVTIEDNDMGPDIAIVADSSLVSEGDSAFFTITTSHSALTDIALTLQLRDPQGFANRSSNALSATIPAGELTTVLELPIPDNQTGEQDGELEVTLLSSSQYFINPDQMTAQVTILDNDLPRLSVRPTAYAYEDEEATFALHATVDVPSELMVNYNVNVEGDYWTNVSGDFQASFYDNQIPGTPTNQSRLVQIGYNGALQEDGSVTLTINPGPGYNVATAPENQATNAILDRQTPTFGIYPVNTTLPEGNQALFYISTRATILEPLPVSLEYSTTGNFVSGSLPNSVTIPADAQWALLRIATENDDEFEPAGDLTVQIVDGPGYRPHSQDSSSSIAIIDDDGPVLSIAADTNTIDEATYARFNITASKQVDEDLTIPIAVNATGEFLLTTDFDPVVLPANSTAVQFEVAIVDDTTIELNGSVEARILQNNSYALSAEPNDRATVIVRDNDAPTGISILAMMASVQEGQVAQFKIQSDSPLSESVAIGIAVTSDGSFLTTSTPQQVELAPGELEVLLEIFTINDQLDEPAGSITVTLQSGTGYQVASSHLSASINVLDNDDPPVISISSGETIDEGDDAEFVITTSQATSLSKEIVVTLSETSDFITGGTEGDNATRIITLPANQVTTTLMIPTDASDDPEQDGLITATLASPSDEGEYRIAPSPNNTATVQVLDHNLPRVSIGSIISETAETGIIFFELSWTQTLPTGTAILMHSELEGDFFEATEYSGDFNITTDPWSVITLMVQLENDTLAEADGSIKWTIRDSEDYNVNPRFSSKTVRILDDDAPRVSIASGTESITEGEEGELIVTADNPVSSDLVVQLNLNIIGDYEFTELPSSVTIRAGATSATLTLELEDDEQIETDGMLMASLESDPNYNLVDQSDAVAVNLLDSEQLRVAVATDSDIIIEGELAEFRIFADQTPTQDIEVGLISTATGDFILSEIPEAITILAGRTEVHLSLQSQDDSEYESDGSINLTITTSNDFNIAHASKSASIAIKDNDGPTITIAGESSIIEGGVALFTLTASSQPNEDLLVNIEVTEIGDFIDEELPTDIDVLAASSSGLLEIYTEDDSLDENDGTMSVSILPGANYQVGNGPESSATTIISDNDTDSVISLAAVFSTIIEGQHVGFEISATTASQVPRFIPVEIKSTSGNFLSQPETTTFHLNASERIAHVSIPTLDNLNYETTGAITAEIKRGDGYTIADFPNNIATVAVFDNDAPTGLSIIALKDIIAEGEVARFQITAHSAEPVARIINIQVQDTESYIDGTVPTRIVLPTAATSHILELQTQYDSADLPSGEITVTIDSSTENIVASEPNNSATIYVQDQERPTLSIATGLEVLEGETADFTITASQLSADPLNINLAVSQSDNYFDILPEKIAHLAAGEQQVIYSIPINDNDLDTSDSQLTITLLEGLDYQIESDSTDKVTITIKDNDPPAISLTAIDTNVDEGDIVRLELQSSTPPQADLPVEFSITRAENSNFLANLTQTLTETISAGTTWQRFSIQTIDDQVYELTGDFNVEILPNPNYTIAESAGIALVEVADNDFPVLSVSTQESFNEGDNVEFLITSDLTPLEDIDINFKLSQFGDYVIDAVPDQITLPAGTNSITFAITTRDNTIDEFDGILDFTLFAGEGYQLEPTTSQTSTTILDNDHNIVSIVADSEFVVEGVDQFTSIQISIDQPIQTHSVQVNLEYHAIGFFFTTGTFNYSDQVGFGAEWRKQFRVTIPAGETQVTHSLALQSDNEFEASGQVSVQLLEGEHYTVSATNDHTLTRIFDDDAPTGISIYPVGADEYLESETAVFEIRSDSIVNQSIEVYFDVSETGQYISGIIPNKVVIPKGQDWARIEIPLDDDTITEDESELIVQILPRPNYSVTAEFYEASVSIYDNDLIVASIRSLGTINEGSDALFEIAVTPASQNYITVDYYLTEVGEFLAGHPSRYVDFERNQESVIVAVPTENDDEFEMNGEIIATLSGAYDYRVSETAGQARVAVVDDETPAGISILAESESIIEGGLANFQIRSNVPSIFPREIGIELIGNSKQLVESYPEYVTFLPGATETQLSLQTINDYIYQPNQQIEVQLIDDSEISLSDSHQMAQVLLLENDVPEVSLITNSDSPIREGSTIEISIATNTHLIEDLTVMLNSQYSEHLTSFSVPTSIIIPAGMNSYNLQIPTDLDDLFEEDSEILVQVVENSNYRIGIAQHQARIQIIDANLSTATISTSTSEVLEGDELEILVQLDPALAYEDAEIRIKHEFVNDGLVQVEWKTLSATAGDTELRYTLTAPDNFQREVNKSLVATVVPTWNELEESYNYRLEDATKSVAVTILDNDSPTGISVYALTDTVTEGDIVRIPNSVRYSSHYGSNF